ncbi:MAG: NAD(P)-dependent oxidoreductase [Chloroflexi bacterium]|nr:NAD(P)-dependent oxidoreductase [Chloroflexota bacterium]
MSLAELRVGFIGTGNIGNPMAMNVLKAGFPLTVHDARRAATENLLSAGASWANSAAAVAEASDVVLASLPGPAESEAVALGPNGVLDGLKRGGIFVDLTTSSPAMAKKISAAFAERDLGMLDAPVTGGVPGARAGQLTIIVGGDASSLERVRPVLNAIGNRIYHMGEPGTGCIGKIANNLLALSSAFLVGEAYTLGIKAGVEPRRLHELITNGAGYVWMLDHTMPNFLFKGNFDGGFSINLTIKDLQLAADLGRELDVPLPFASLAEQAYVSARAAGLGNKHFEAALTLLERLSGVEIRIPEAQS